MQVLHRQHNLFQKGVVYERNIVQLDRQILLSSHQVNLILLLNTFRFFDLLNLNAIVTPIARIISAIPKVTSCHISDISPT